MAVEFIDRPPRVQPELPVEEVEIPQPPDEERGIGQDLPHHDVTLNLYLGIRICFRIEKSSLHRAHGFNDGRHHNCDGF